MCGQTPAPVTYEGLRDAALYNYGYLITWDNPQFREMTLYGRDAKPAYTVEEHKDGIYHAGWAVDSDGVAAAVYRVGQSWKGRIDLFDPSGKLTRTIDTGSYVSTHVVFAPDHTIWTAGYYAHNDGSQDFNVLHHYSRTGEELGHALHWSEIAGDHNSYTALQSLIGGRQLFVANDRIGFFVRSHYGQDTWVEVSFSGIVLGKYELAKSYELCDAPVAMTAGGSVYAAVYKDERFAGWAELDRSNHAWRELAGYPKGRIIGVEEENLVFSKREGATTVLQFVPTGSLTFDSAQQDTAELVANP